MKALLIFLLFSLSLCEIEYQQMEIAKLSTNLNENTANGEFTACIACLQNENCKKIFYEQVLYDLTDDYDKEDLTLEACQSLSGRKDFDMVVKEHLARQDPPLLSRKSLKFKKISPEFEIKEPIDFELKKIDHDDVILRSIKSWIKDRLNKLADKIVDEIHDALVDLVDKFTDWAKEKLHKAIDKI